MITISDNQRWVCERTKRRGTLIDITGLWRGADGVMLYSNVSSTRRAVGKITVWELRRNWRLMSCAHTDIADECSICRCPFHGTEQCDCRAENRS